MRYRLLAVIALTLLAGCNLTTEPQNEQPLTTATAFVSGKPTVQIVAPGSGDEFVVGDEVLVSVVAADSVGVQRVQLTADGQVVKTVSSESPSGDQALNVLLDYTPREEGDVTLQVVAFRGAIASDPQSVEIVIREEEADVTATAPPAANVPIIDPNDPTCRALVNVGLNLRGGPATSFNVIRVLAAGSVVPLVGRLASNEWWQVRAGTDIGWISAGFTTVYGNCTGIPVVVAPATPTVPVARTNTPLPVPPTFTPVPSITPTPGPADLVVANISGPQEVVLAAGETSVTETYALTLTNTGGQTTGQFNNVFILSGPSGNVEIPAGVVANLGRNESIVLQVEVTFGGGAGSYTLQGRADYNNNIAELSEVNNAGVFQVTVLNAAS